MLTFPASPTIGQVFVGPNNTWQWDGTKWPAIGGGMPVPVPPDGAPTGTPQYPDLFRFYAGRPAFAVPGVDYRVGINTGVELVDWQTITGPGIIQDANGLRFDSLSNIVLDGIDLSLHLGARLSFVGCNGVSITNCKMAGLNLPKAGGIVIAFDITCQGPIVIKYNDIDTGGDYGAYISGITKASPCIVSCPVPHGFLTGASVAFGEVQGMVEINGLGATINVIDLVTFSAAIDTTGFSTYTGGGKAYVGSSSAIYNISSAGNTSMDLEFNWIRNVADRIITMFVPLPPATGSLIYRYNICEQGAYDPSAHLNFLEWERSGATGIAAASCDHNLIRQTIHALSGGEGLQFYFNGGGGTLVSPVVTNNVIIAKSDDPTSGPYISNMFHGNDTSTLQGNGLLQDNWFDDSASFGWFYSGSFNDNPPFAWMITGNNSLVTMQEMDDFAGVLYVRSIAPTINGMEMRIQGAFGPGLPGDFFLVLDGETVIAPDVVVIRKAGGSGNVCSGWYTIDFPAPSVGDHFVSVHATSGSTAAVFDVTFTVGPITAPYITVDTPAETVEFSPMTVTGRWFNTKPAGMRCTADGFFPRVVANFVANDDGTWSFDTTCPPAVHDSEAGPEDFKRTLTITALGILFVAPVITTDWFVVDIEPSLTILTPFSGFHAAQTIAISGGYGGPTPTGMTYAFDGGSPVAASSPLIGSGRWTFNVLAPALGTHTVTVHGTGPNTASITSASFTTLAQVFAPGAPGTPSAVIIGADMVVLTWTAPTTGSPVDAYELQYALHGSSTWNVVSGGTSSLFFAITGLALGTDYDFRVNGLNIGGIGPFATVSGITTLAAFADGYPTRPSGVSPQYASILSGYTHGLPGWHVAGVAYGVGYPTSTVLTDWTALSGTGIVLAANSVTVTGVASPVFDSVDFSLHGGASIAFVGGTTNATVSNCKFGGAFAPSALISTDITSPGLTARNCILNSGPTIGDAPIWIKGGGTCLIEYNYCTIDTVYFVDAGSPVSQTITLQWNAISTTQLYKDQVGVGFTTTPTIVFNTCYGTTHPPAGGTGIDFSNVAGVLHDPVISNNTLIAVGTGGAVSYWILGAPSSGVAVLFENYMDWTNGFGPFYGGTFGGWVLAANWDLVTGAALTNNP